MDESMAAIKSQKSVGDCVPVRFLPSFDQKEFNPIISYCMLNCGPLTDSAVVCTCIICTFTSKKPGLMVLNIRIC